MTVFASCVSASAKPPVIIKANGAKLNRVFEGLRASARGAALVAGWTDKASFGRSACAVPKSVPLSSSAALKNSPIRPAFFQSHDCPNGGCNTTLMYLDCSEVCLMAQCWGAGFFNSSGCFGPDPGATDPTCRTQGCINDSLCNNDQCGGPTMEREDICLHSDNSFALRV